MWSDRASRTTISPPATPTAARECLPPPPDRRRRWVAPWSSPGGVPCTTSVGEPTPSIWAPMAMRKWHRSTISGSRRVVERGRPLGEGGGHDEVLGGADAQELEDDVGRPETVVGDGLELVGADREAGPSASKPAMWKSIGRDPKSSPPGRARRKRPQRARSGPSTAVDARMRRARSGGATQPTSGGLVSRRVRRSSDARSSGRRAAPAAPA